MDSDQVLISRAAQVQQPLLTLQQSKRSRVMKDRYQRQSDNYGTKNPFIANSIKEQSEFNLLQSTRVSVTYNPEISFNSAYQTLQQPQQSPSSFNQLPEIFKSPQQLMKEGGSHNIPNFNIQASQSFDYSNYNQKKQKVLKPPEVVLDYPRQIRLSSNDCSLNQVRQTLRRNRVLHPNYDPSLDSLKSKLLLEGIYVPNTNESPKEAMLSANDFIKDTGNYKRETVKICDLYGSQDLSTEKKSKWYRTKRDNKEQLSIRDKVERHYVHQLLKTNAERNQDDNSSHSDGEEGDNNHNQKTEFQPPVQLSYNQLKSIYELMEKKNKCINDAINRSFETQVKTLEKMFDNGYTIEYNKKPAEVKKAFVTDGDDSSIGSIFNSRSNYVYSKSKHSKQRKNWKKVLDKKKTQILESRSPVTQQKQQRVSPQDRTAIFLKKLAEIVKS